jgi:hypothetical protein
MVEAAKNSKRKTSTTKVITNADLKKSKAKVTQLTEKDQKAVLITPSSSGPTMLQKQDAALKADAETKVRIASAEKEVAELERDLLGIERNYFEESDLDRRDKLITRQFADTKAKLAAAKAALAALTGSP